MSKIYSLLSLESEVPGKSFSDQDIEWVENTLGLKNGFDEHQLAVLHNLESLDVEACPGSGKTTVLVAKLALLARYWKPKNQGICVLSMTNAAREEIKERLGNTIEGQSLLHPPHFIGTIHSFFSEFLAKPYLNSNGMTLVSIDDDFCRSQRRKTLQKDEYLCVTDFFVEQQRGKRLDIINKSKQTTQKYLEARQWLDEHDEKTVEEKRLGIPVHWRMLDIEYNVATDRGKPLDLPLPLEKKLKAAIKEVVKKGIFAFSDIFVYSKALMDSSSCIFDIVRTRFPLLFIDEAQDTSRSQAEMIHELFLSDENSSLSPVVRQRFGDANQTIYSFEPPMPIDGVDPYPSNSFFRLTIPVSHRFDQSIAKLASPFETHPLEPPMYGNRQEAGGGKNHCIFIFDDKTKQNVIPSFLEYAANELEDEILHKADIRVLSHIHKERDEEATIENFARTIRDYYTPYVADKMTKEYQQHSFLVEYVRHARFLVRETKDIKLGVDKVAEGIYKACLMDNEDTIPGSPFPRIKARTDKHRAISRETSKEVFLPYCEKMINLLTSCTSLTGDVWNNFIVNVDKVVASLNSKPSGNTDEINFYKWIEDDGMSSAQNNKFGSAIERSNVYRHFFVERTCGFIDVKLGTIHSVKGQTHTASLLLESTNNGPILGQLKSYLLGFDLAKESSKRKRDWLNTLYVGMTRPTHLICLAIPENHKKNSRTDDLMSWTEEDFTKLKSRGWKIARVNSDSKLEFI